MTAPQRPRGGHWRRVWRTRSTTQAPGDTQRPVGALGVDENQAPPGHCQIALNAAYRERAHLVALLAALETSCIGHTDPTAPDWAVVTIELPTGQACWHIAPADMDLFQHVQPAPRWARGWDGHSTDEKYKRIREFTAALAEGAR